MPNLEDIMSYVGSVGGSQTSLPVKWIKSNDPPQAEVRDGVCNLYMPDHPHGDIPYASKLIQDCLTKGGLSDGTPPGSARLNWFQVPDTKNTFELYDMVNGKYKGKGVHMNGFEWGDQKNNDPMNIVTTKGNERSLGHEIKHYYDGLFHK